MSDPCDTVLTPSEAVLIPPVRRIGSRYFIFGKIEGWYGWYELLPSEIPETPK